MELIDHFLSDQGENDQSREGVDREVLKRIVDSVGFVKVENGVKFVCLNTGGSVESVMRTDADGCDQAECNGNVRETLDNSVNGNPDNGDQTGEGDASFVLVLFYIIYLFFSRDPFISLNHVT